MKMLACLLFFCFALSAAEPQKFSASRLVNRPIGDVKAAAQIYWREAKTNYPSLYFAEPMEEPGRVTQIWMDCAGAPPGALTGKITLTRELGPLTGTRLEVSTGATLLEDAQTAARRAQRTTNVLDGIILVLERKR
jgi:hypothetical protein